jgi:hypothetical protein
VSFVRFRAPLQHGDDGRFHIAMPRNPVFKFSVYFFLLLPAIQHINFGILISHKTKS